MKTYLFGNDSIATAEGGFSRYAHTFGGPADRKGTSREECNGIWIHLLHRFDLNDPAIPIPVAPAGVRWLPLYYCFDFRANTLGYQLVSDELLVTFFPTDDPNVSKREEWPDENYPPTFPQSPVTVLRYRYDPTDFDDAYAWGGVFGIGKLSTADQEKAKARAVEEIEALGFEPPADDDFQECFSNPFLQGRPVNACVNPRCRNHDRKGQLATIALVPAEPVPGVHTFGRWGAGTRLIFQMCGECRTIRVDNECT